MPEESLFLYARPVWIARTFCGDGQRYTELIASWLREYLGTFQVLDDQFSVNTVSFIKDGGVDGLIEADGFHDPLGLLTDRSVLQFKASDSRASEAVEELTKEPEEGKQRIRDFIEKGYKVVWFVAKTLTEIERCDFEETLLGAVQEINEHAPAPSVIDTNRLSAYLSKVPTLALSLQGLNDVGETLSMALSNPPHSEPPFAEPVDFTPFVNSLTTFIESEEKLRIFQGVPGIGKSRRILEALSRINSCNLSTLYLRSQRDLERLMVFFRRQDLRGFVVVDDYIEGDWNLPRIRQDEVPNGCKIILIRHSFMTARQPEANGYLDIPELTDAELDRVLEFYTEERGVSAVLRGQAIALSRRNVRLAKWICETVDPTGGLTQDDFNALVFRELDDAENSGVVKRLSLVRILSRNRLEEFCGLIQRDPGEFLNQCEAVHQRSAFIQFNDVLMYVSIPFIAQLALIRFWDGEQRECRRIFEEPGTFAEDLLQRTNGLPPGPAKEALLGFFSLPSGPVSLERLWAPDGYGKRFLTLVTADPERYLPLLYNAFASKREVIKELPYEQYGPGVDRRNVIWILRGLAQFEEFFEQCEDVVYWMARDEAPTPYANTATSYWRDWFRAWFAFTEYPYRKRLDRLEERIRTGDQRARELAVTALANPFPDVGSDVPRERVGGRLVPEKAHQILNDDIRVAVERIPALFHLLLSHEDSAAAAGKAWSEQMFGWLEVTGRTSDFLDVVRDSHFPREALREVYNQARRYVGLGGTDDERLANLHQLHAKVLQELGPPDDPQTDAEFVLKESDWDLERNKESEEREAHLLDTVAHDSAALDSIRPILYHSESWGAGRFGERLANLVGEELLWSELNASFGQDHRSFVLGLLAGFLKLNPELARPVRALVKERENEFPHWSLAIYHIIGTDPYAEAGARLLRQGLISPRAFAHAWVNVDFVYSAAGRELREALERQVDGGEDEAIETVLSLARGFEHKKLSDPVLVQFCLKAVLAKQPQGRGRGDHGWASVALWLLTYSPVAVINKAAEGALEPHSDAIRVLAEGAKTHPQDVLAALGNQLSKKPSLGLYIKGNLPSIFSSIEGDLFASWLNQLGSKAMVRLARYLPRPFLAEDGRAIVPLHTRLYWEHNKLETADFERAMREFGLATFSTGAFWGHGVDLFSQRVRVAEQLLHDQNPAIAAWAENHLQESRQMLNDALRDEAEDQASRDTDG